MSSDSIAAAAEGGGEEEEVVVVEVEDKAAERVARRKRKLQKMLKDAGISTSNIIKHDEAATRRYSRRARKAPASIYEDKHWSKQFKVEMLKNVDPDELDIPYAQYEGLRNKQAAGAAAATPSVTIRSVEAAVTAEGAAAWRWQVVGNAVSDCEKGVEVELRKAKGEVIDVVDMDDSAKTIIATILTTPLQGLALEDVRARQKLKLHVEVVDSDGDLQDSDEEDEEDAAGMVRDAAVVGFKVVKPAAAAWEWRVVSQDDTVFQVGDAVFVVHDGLRDLRVAITAVARARVAPSDKELAFAGVSNNEPADALQITTTVSAAHVSALRAALSAAPAACLLRRAPRHNSTRRRKHVHMEAKAEAEAEAEADESDDDLAAVRVNGCDKEDSDFEPLEDDEDDEEDEEAADSDKDDEEDEAEAADSEEDEGEAADSDGDSDSGDSEEDEGEAADSDSGDSDGDGGGAKSADHAAAVRVANAAAAAPAARNPIMLEIDMLELELVSLETRQPSTAIEAANMQVEKRALQCELVENTEKVAIWQREHAAAAVTAAEVAAWQARQARMAKWTGAA